MLKNLSAVDADSIMNIVGANNIIKSDVIKMLSVSGEVSEEQLMELYKDTFNVKHVLDRVDSFVHSILFSTKADRYLLYIADHTADKKDMFRYSLAVTKPYKGTRPPTPAYMRYWKPIIAEHLINKWGAIPQRWIEADDACAIAMTKYKDLYNCTLCSPDKDLKQIPGNHYDYSKLVYASIDTTESYRILFAQCMVGDSTDNIPGLKGVGKKSPLLKFPGCSNFEHFKAYTIKCFADKNCTEEYYNEQMSLIFMLREDRYGSTVNLDVPLIFDAKASVADELVPVEKRSATAAPVVPPML